MRRWRNCPKEAIFEVGSPERLLLCLDCYATWSNIQQQAIENHERELNRLADGIDLVTGMPGFTPRYAPRVPRTVLRVGGVGNYTPLAG